MAKASAAGGSKTNPSTLSSLGDRLFATGNKLGNLYIDGCEKSFETVVSLQRKVAAQSRIDSVQTVLDAQADLVSGIGEASVAASRKIVA